MKIISGLEQGSNSWLQWRQNKITATNAAAIMGMNPFQSSLELWQEKVLGWEKPRTQKEIDRMAEGTRLEPIARQRFIEETGLLVEPMVAEHDQFPYIAASFDGLSPDFQTCVEIKCGKKAFILAQLGEIPDYYHWQMHHQMLVCGLESMFYYCFDGENSVVMKYHRIDEMIENLLAKEIDFWHKILALEPPQEAYDTTRPFSRRRN